MSTLIVIGGPTASGKTALAIELARRLRTEIISADSRQFYREMQIGNARPTPAELAAVHHHFVADRSLDQPLSAGRFGEEAAERVTRLFQQHEYLICAGGSGLYLRALCAGLDEFPEVTAAAKEEVAKIWTSAGRSGLQQTLAELDPIYFAQVDQQNPRRLIRALEVCYTAGRPYSSFLGQRPRRPWQNRYFRLDPPRDQLYARIDARVDRMLAAGLEAEARSLEKWRDLPVLRTVGYQEWWPYFAGQYSYDRAVELIKRNSRRYAKRQVTWFGRGDKFQVLQNISDVLQHLKD